MHESYLNKSDCIVGERSASSLYKAVVLNPAVITCKLAVYFIGFNFFLKKSVFLGSRGAASPILHVSLLREDAAQTN